MMRASAAFCGMVGFIGGMDIFFVADYLHQGPVFTLRGSRGRSRRPQFKLGSGCWGTIVLTRGCKPRALPGQAFLVLCDSQFD